MENVGVDVEKGQDIFFGWGGGGFFCFVPFKR